MSTHKKGVHFLTAAQDCSIGFLTIDCVRIIEADFAADRLSTSAVILAYEGFETVVKKHQRGASILKA
jgi:hypothetical protein